jgi:hypothetical protein
MTSEIVYRHDRDGHRVADAGVVNRVSLAAAKRNREAEREAARQNLRDKIGVERPPKTLRERILGVHPAEPPPSGFDVVKALRERRKERERQQRIRHY